MIQDIGSTWRHAAVQAPHLLQPRNRPAGLTSVSAANATRDIDASLSITTKEGDTVSISASYDLTASYASLRGHGERGQAWSTSSSSQVTVQVQGDLSAQELQDISRVVKTFLHDLRAMLRGGDATVANVADGDPQTLQSVSATASTSTTVTAVAANVRGPVGIGAHAGRQGEGDVDGPPRGVALPLPAPEPFVPADVPPAAA